MSHLERRVVAERPVLQPRSNPLYLKLSITRVWLIERERKREEVTQVLEDLFTSSS